MRNPLSSHPRASKVPRAADVHTDRSLRRRHRPLPCPCVRALAIQTASRAATRRRTMSALTHGHGGARCRRRHLLSVGECGRLREVCHLPGDVIPRDPVARDNVTGKLPRSLPASWRKPSETQVPSPAKPSLPQTTPKQLRPHRGSTS